MKASELVFERPPGLEASVPPEAEGRRRDDVRLLVSTPRGHAHGHFRDLPRFLDAGDLLVVNDSATVAASLHAHSRIGHLLINVSTRYGPSTWLVEPRWAHDRPGPVPLAAGDVLRTCAVEVRLIAPYPGTDRLWFAEGDLAAAMPRCGEPIRYGYVIHPQPLSAYQTMFARAPGSAEMPNAARPFTPSVVDALCARGAQIAAVRLHTGVSSLEVETADVEDHPIPPEPFKVGEATASMVNATRAGGGRVIAVGTTVVRALESAWTNEGVAATEGFTRVVVHPGRGVNAVDGMLTGFHDSGASHLAMLHAVAGKDLVASAYEEAVRHRYLWHEFGDSHLLLPG